MLDEKLRKLWKLRNEKANVIMKLRVNEDVYMSTPAYEQAQKYEQEAIDMGNEIKKLEDDIRQEALMISQTSNFEIRHPIDGVEIKKFLLITIKPNQEQTAKIWLAQNAPDLLTINNSKFTKAVENLQLPWIDKSDDYRGQIATDLSKYADEDQ